MRPLTIWLLLAVLGAGPGQTAATVAGEVNSTGGNLVTNPGFDSDVSGWYGPATWDPRHDGGGKPHRGRSG